MRVAVVLLVAVWSLALTASHSVAQTPEARVIVPDAPSGAFVSGCYRADRPLYGPFRLGFCLERRGTYSVQGGGLSCTGRLTWRASRGDIAIKLRRQSCGTGRAWAAAEIVCHPRGLVASLLDELMRDLFGTGSGQGRVMVPDRPTLGKLSCTYLPTVPGTKPRSFVARRVLEQKP